MVGGGGGGVVECGVGDQYNEVWLVTGMVGSPVSDQAHMQKRKGVQRVWCGSGEKGKMDGCDVVWDETVWCAHMVQVKVGHGRVRLPTACMPTHAEI